ncbi:MAG: thioredoxin family protein [Cyclobacteriaceae bacterium]|nr:thioredoxin family protein [Cyclobacteriaceae bacterium]
MKSKIFKLKILLLFLIGFFNQIQAQILQPAKWSYDFAPSEVKIGEEVDLIFNVKIDRNWYLYSSDFDPDLGPMVTEFSFVPHQSYELIGEIIPVNPSKGYDDIFNGEYTYFKGTGQFRQKIVIRSENPVIRGEYSYQVCSDVDGKCIPFDDDFEFSNIKVKGGVSASESRQSQAEPTKRAKEEAAEVNDGADNAQEKSAAGPMFEVKEFQTEARETNLEDRKSGEKTSVLKQRSPNDAYSLLAFIFIAFLGGLAALFTPCVFPMIPMTVSFFTGKAKTRPQAVKNAFIYGFSIILIYTVIGSVFAPFMGPGMANELATNWIPNVIFSLVFIIFALSFFGLFEITLPSSFVNKMDKKADQGGIIGIFFMAFTLVLVSFSCTGPIVGSILVESAGGLVLKPILGMFGFSLAFAIPFTLFAIFPEWLNSLPKSGGWLNSVKVFLGFIELALALKFLSVADQAYHWGILDREIYIAFWIVIFTLLGFYFLGKIRLPHDSELKHVSVGRLMLAIITFTFVTYLVPGMFGAPLKGLAGYLPPLSTHDFNLSNVIMRSEMGYADIRDELCDDPEYADFLHLPHDIRGYFDYEQALACAREKNKPLFIDFTGHGCVNCREMEARVWSNPEVLRRLRNDFVVVALYVDDKKELPENKWYTSKYDGKVKKSIGKQNADFQITRFQNNAQPFYVILDANEEMLLEPKAYDLNASNFVSFLDDALEKFEQKASTF